MVDWVGRRWLSEAAIMLPLLPAGGGVEAERDKG